MIQLFFSVLLLVGSSYAATWGYLNQGADIWKDTFPACADSSQSPIDIKGSLAMYNASLDEFKLIDYVNLRNFTISNNGHTAKVDFTGEAYIENGGLPEKYKLAQFHFHWGANDLIGSEHTVDDTAYPMEVHFVHFKDSLGELGAAVNEPEGLAVLGFFFKIDDSPNSNYAHVIDALTDIRDPYGNTTKKSIAAQSLLSLIPSTRSNYFRYPGSLTTPPCAESVIWTVFDDAIPISSNQMAEFRKMLSSEKDGNSNSVQLVDNYRPVQPLNSRSIQSSFQVSYSPEPSSSNSFGVGFSSVFTALLAYVMGH